MDSGVRRKVLRWLGGGRAPGKRLERDLAALERAARMAPPGSSGQYYNRAGDLCEGVGERMRAIAYYGRAVDALLDGGRYDAAGAVCRKMLRLEPGIVRARCTLAWLAIGKGLLGEAQKQIDAYARAARGPEEAALAIRQLRLMAAAAPDAGTRGRIAGRLRELGDAEGARRAAAPRPTAPQDEEAHWERVLRYALMGPDELLRGEG